MQARLLNAVIDSTEGSVYTKANTSVFEETFTFQVTTTGSPTGLVVTIYGSIDGTNYEAIIIHDVIVDGQMFHLSGKPITHMKAAATTIAGGTTPTVTLIVGG